MLTTGNQSAPRLGLLQIETDPSGALVLAPGCGHHDMGALEAPPLSGVLGHWLASDEDTPRVDGGLLLADDTLVLLTGGTVRRATVDDTSLFRPLRMLSTREHLALATVDTDCRIGFRCV